MNAFVFPGQGSQFQGMGKDLADEHQKAANLFAQANDILGFSLTDIMFSGSADELRQTRVTQPAIFVHSMAVRTVLGDGFSPQMVAGHSLGEFSALTAIGALTFADGLQLVAQRAQAMQDACNQSHGTMAAVLALADEVVEDICTSIDGIVVAANYNCPGQLVISGEIPAVETACEKLKEKGYYIINLDINIIAEKPKINKYVSKMIKNISTLLQIKNSSVSIKATTNEKIGFIGNGEGIAAESIVHITDDKIS